MKQVAFIVVSLFAMVSVAQAAGRYSGLPTWEYTGVASSQSLADCRQQMAEEKMKVKAHGFLILEEVSCAEVNWAGYPEIRGRFSFLTPAK